MWGGEGKGEGKGEKRMVSATSKGHDVTALSAALVSRHRGH